MNTKDLMSKMTYHYAWLGELPLKWNGIILNARLVVKADNGNPISKIQEASLSFILKSSEILSAKAKQALASFCATAYKVAVDEVSLICSIVPTSVVVDYTGDWGITFATPWDNDMDVAVRYDGDKVIVGLDDILI